MFDSDILEWHLEIGVDSSFLGWLFEIRQTLEPLACATAALRRTTDQLKTMHKALQAMYKCETNRQGFTKADLRFIKISSRRRVIRSCNPSAPS